MMGGPSFVVRLHITIFLVTKQTFQHKLVVFILVRGSMKIKHYRHFTLAMTVGNEFTI